MNKRSDIWKQKTTYKVGQIIYPDKPNGFYYVCVQSGTTKSTTEGYSNSFEPTWQENRSIEDRFLIWKPLPHDPNPSVTEWEPDKLYHLGNKVHPASGSLRGLYSYILLRIIAEPVWPTEIDAVIEDGTVSWQAKISTQSFIPQELTTDELHTEFHRLVDYLLESNVLVLNDVLFKFKDRSKLQIGALQALVTEQGYEYIADVLSLTKDQLETLMEYINLIHFLKGTRTGLELVLNLLGIAAVIKEWWEEEPTQEAHTFTLSLDFNLGNIKRDSVRRIADFTAHYVFPKLRQIIINYEAELAQKETYLMGVADQDFHIDSGDTFVLHLSNFLHIETTVSTVTMVPDIGLFGPFPNQIIMLPGDIALAIP